MDKERLLKLLGDVKPLILSQSRLVDYRRYNYTFKEIYTLYEDKVINIVLKYHNKEYNELLYITLASIKRHTYAISRMLKKNNYIPLEEEITPTNNSVDISSLFEQLKSKLRVNVDHSLLPLLDIILTPPIEVTKGLKTSTRIPNSNYLKYLGIPRNEYNIKVFQKHRDMINNIIREQIDNLEF